MLASIHPLGERARHQRWVVTVTAFVVASTVGGVLIGAIAGSIGAAARVLGAGTEGAIVVGAFLVLAAGAAEATGRRVPGPRRQVDETWLQRYRGWVYGGGFGFQLGLAVSTKVTTALVWLALGLAALSGSPLGGAAIGAAFGLVRALPVVALRRVESAEALRHFHQGLAASAARARRVSAGATGALGGVLVVTSVIGA